ncbi:MAG: glycosyltransferase family 4 protein [Vicinamibacterales bacterium]
MSRVRPRVCFVAHNAFGELAGVDTGHAGGIERQQAMMARWLSGRDFDVDMVTWNEGQADGSSHRGVRVLTLCRRDAGLPGLRFVHPRWTSLHSALGRAAADVYYYNCGDMGLGQLGLWCRRKRAKLVYSVASEPDCDPRLPRLRDLRERVLYRYGLRRASRVITQTHRQQRLLREGFGVESVVLPMPCGFPVEPRDPGSAPDPGGVGRVLWVGRFSAEKRLEWLLDLAVRHPKILFDVVGAPNSESPDSRALASRAAGCANVTLHGRRPLHALPGFYDRAHVLCCTSSYEGFPNTFLEAWSRGLPVLTTFDPDDVVRTHGLGWTAQTLDGLSDCLTSLLADPDGWRARSEAAVRYYREHHELDRAMGRFVEVLSEVAR